VILPLCCHCRDHIPLCAVSTLPGIGRLARSYMSASRCRFINGGQMHITSLPILLPV
jgi:hypothetical protein